MGILESLGIIKEKVKFNGVELTRQQLSEKIKEIENQKNMKVVETSPGVFKTKLYD